MKLIEILAYIIMMLFLWIASVNSSVNGVVDDQKAFWIRTFFFIVSIALTFLLAMYIS